MSEQRPNKVKKQSSSFATLSNFHYFRSNRVISYKSNETPTSMRAVESTKRTRLRIRKLNHSCIISFDQLHVLQSVPHVNLVDNWISSWWTFRSCCLNVLQANPISEVPLTSTKHFRLSSQSRCCYLGLPNFVSFLFFFSCYFLPDSSKTRYHIS